MSHPINAVDKESLEVFTLLFDFGQEKKAFEWIRISHFWTEKINIIIQLIQLFSFVFACNYTIWPLRWQGMYKSTHLSLIAGDLGTLYYDRLYSSPEYRLLYCGGWIILCALFAILYFFIRVIAPISVITRVEFQRSFFKFAHFMYLPVALGVFPVALCQYDNCSLDGGQLVVSILTLFVISGYLIAYPVYLIVHVYGQVISTDPEEYNEFIKLKEMEFLLGVSPAWLTEKLYLFSSYRSSKLRVYHRPVYYGFVLLMVAVDAAINTSNMIKLLVLLSISGIFSLYITIFPVYRCLSSSYLYSFTMWLITSNFFIGFLKASGYQSQTMVDENLVNILVAINITGLVLIVIIFIMIYVFNIKWDIGIDSIKQLAIAYRCLLSDLRNAQKMILTLRTFTNYNFVKFEPIEKMTTLLTDHYKLLSDENHPLQYTVLEQLDILCFIKGQVHNETLLPSKNLERDYGLLKTVVTRRWREQILINPIKRRLLLKLGVLKLFLGNRETKPFNSGDDSNCFKKGEKTTDRYDIDKFYKEFEDMESSGDVMVDTKRNLVEDIEEAVESKDINALIKATEIQLDYQDQQVLLYLKNVWNAIGIEKLPKNLYDHLFNI